MKEVLVSIIMAVHNEKEIFLRQSLDSLFQQSYRNVEIIIIDDASNEECRNNLNIICEKKDNVKIIHNEKNIGLTKSLNIGLRNAKGKYIARMDADDISFVERIEKQVNYLNKHPEIDIVGTGVISFGNKKVFMSPCMGLNNNEAQCYLFFSSTLCHPSVMIRQTFLDKYNLSYDENIKRGQDYDLWERASIYGRISVMKDILLFYRLHSSQITSTNKADQDLIADKIRKRRLSRIGIVPTEMEYKCHQLLMGGCDKNVTFHDINSWIEKLLSYNKKYLLVVDKEFRRNLQERLILYKIRNHISPLSFSFKDIIALFKVLFNRIYSWILLRTIEIQIP